MKILKRNIKWFFYIWLVFVTQGVSFKQCNTNIFFLTNKIKIKIYDIMEHKYLIVIKNSKEMILLITKKLTQKCKSSENLQRNNFV